MWDERYCPFVDAASINVGASWEVSMLNTPIEQMYVIVNFDALPKKYEIPITRSDPAVFNPFIIDVVVWLNLRNNLAFYDIAIPLNNIGQVNNNVMDSAALKSHEQLALLRVRLVEQDPSISQHLVDSVPLI